jgi:hypothetical protein
VSTLAQLIRRDRQHTVRRVYIKRRLYEGGFEASWTRIDNWKNANRIISYGTGTWSINHEPGQIPSFDVTGITLMVDNSEGHFNHERDTNSIFSPEFTYIRPLSKIKIEAGYLDDDDSEVGVDNIFEGLIAKPVIKGNETASISVLSYANILQQYDVSDLSLTGVVSVSTAIASILNQSKITDYITYTAPVPDQDIDIDQGELSGTYWSALKSLAFVSNSIMVVEGSDLFFKARTAGVSSVYDFKGRLANDKDNDIFRVTNFDDEGRDRVRVYWRNSESGSSLSSTSTNDVYLTRYLGAPQEIDLSIVDTEADKQTILDALLAQWEAPKPIIQFESKFLVNEVSPLNRITIKYLGDFDRDITGDGFTWDNWNWDDGSVWGDHRGGINIHESQQWMVTEVKKNLDKWSSTIKAERIF